MKHMKLIFTSSILVIFSLFSITASAETKVTTKLVDGKKFRDYQLTGYSRNKSLVVLQKSFNKLFTELVEKKQDQGILDKDLTMEVAITDIDLEGFYHFALGPQIQDMRIVDSNTPFRMNFKYKIMDAQGKVLEQGEHEINELANPSLTARGARRSGYVSYYIKPLKKWFDKTFN
ncbi:MAG: DUF3016 domain-containing protein [Enterobacterales bacterium]|nr:DUF3016 domain-containing protein [Enterobacterales bacterium]